MSTPKHAGTQDPQHLIGQHIAERSRHMHDLIDTGRTGGIVVSYANYRSGQQGDSGSDHAAYRTPMSQKWEIYPEIVTALSI